MKTTKAQLTAADFRVGQKVYSCHKPFGCKWFIEEIGETFVKLHGLDNHFPLSEIKPILRRMDSMSDDEIRRYQDLCWEETFELSSSTFHDTIESVLWLLDNGFDVRGWIDDGLAVDAATIERSSE